MEIVSEGSLESISRPASTSKRCSSRSSVKSASRSNQHSLEFLPPEEPTLNLSANFEVEDDIVVTDITEDINLDNEQELPLSDESSLQDNVEHVNYQMIINCSLSSDETALPDKPEQEIINSVKEDRSTNPPTFENTTENSEVPSKCDVNLNQDENNDLEIHSAESESSSTAGRFDNDDLDPKIRKGMERIKKLDNILIEKVKREKEVKKQRRDQERLWREHLEMLEKSRNIELGKPVDLGPAHMLALGAPNDTDSISEDSPPVTPLFATQPLVDEERLQRQMQQEETSSETHEHSVNTPDRDDMSSNGCKARVSQGETNGEKEKKNKKNKKDRKVKRKDFIKRNILLAADASNVLAMTEEEKKRLEEILSDIGDLTEELVNKESLTLFGNGFVPSQEEAKQLKDIDARLQTLVSSEEYAALCGQIGSERGKQSLRVATPRSENGSFISDEDIPTFGELVLQEKKKMREMKQRLMAIEEELQRFQDEDHNEGFLSESLLRQLLDESSRTTSQATTILDRISSTSMSCDTTSSFDKNSVILDTSSTSALEQ